jgi:cysteine-rich repeat protein
MRSVGFVLLSCLGLPACGIMDGMQHDNGGTLSIESPTPGQVFRATDDTDATQAGVQIAVMVWLEGFASGTVVSLVVNGDDDSRQERFYTGASLYFTGVTLQEGSNTIRAAAGSASDDVTVTLEARGCPYLAFLDPVNEQRLRPEDDVAGGAADGFQYDVLLSTDAQEGSPADLLVNDRPAASGTVSGGRASFPNVTLLAAYPETSALVSLQARTADDCTATIIVQIVVAEACPEFAFVQPSDGRLFRPSEDENADPDDGFQTTVAATTDANDSTPVQLLVGGETAGTTAVSAGGVRFPGVTLPPGPSTLRVQSSADCGEEIGVQVLQACAAIPRCGDDDACNGGEACVEEVCYPGTPLEDGAACLPPDGVEGVCVAGRCSTMTCGNGTIEAPEECDDANDSNVDACLANCVAASCGDGWVRTDEEACDGDPARECPTSCGSTGLQECVECAWADCTPPEEICNGVDDDCDELTDEGIAWFRDLDGDDYGNLASGTPIYGECERPPGYADNGDDCDDSRETVHPGAHESCDGLDTDCDGTIPAEETDADGDGAPLCAPDCNDWNPLIYPTAPEVCNGVDDDCDGTTDEGC